MSLEIKTEEIIECTITVKRSEPAVFIVEHNKITYIENGARRELSTKEKIYEQLSNSVQRARGD